MTYLQLVNKLRGMYQNAPEGERTTMIHLFGILHANELKNYTLTEMNEIAKYATGESGAVGRGSPGYGAEICKTAKLSKYVELKGRFHDKFK